MLQSDSLMVLPLTCPTGLEPQVAPQVYQRSAVAQRDQPGKSTGGGMREYNERNGYQGPLTPVSHILSKG